MQNVLFLNRVALIGNLAFAVMIVMRYWGDIFHNETISSYFITAGYAVLAINSFLLVFFIFKRGRMYFQMVPLWLRIGNFAFFMIEIILLMCLIG